MIIDFHTHAFPDRIAPAALETLIRGGGGLNPNTDGTVSGLLKVLAQNGAQGVLLPIATKPTQQRHINDWAASVNGGALTAFGSVHPDAPDALDELERIKALGLQGVKLHPEYQHFFVDEDRMRPIYRKIGALGLTVVFHAGMDIGFGPPVRCSPEGLLRALDALAGATVVAAHMGGYMLWDRVLSVLCGRALYFDTAYSHSHIIKPLMEKIIEKHGVERILFGTDLPWSTIENERRLLDSLGLSAAETERILYQNARAILTRRDDGKAVSI